MPVDRLSSLLRDFGATDRFGGQMTTGRPMPAGVEPDAGRTIRTRLKSTIRRGSHLHKAKRDGVSTAWPRRECGAVFLMRSTSEQELTAVWRKTQAAVLARI